MKENIEEVKNSTKKNEKLMENKKFKSGFVTVVGRTNVGKSSLINKLANEKISAVADKTQTTRKNVKAIINRENSQIIFIDTPGIHKPKSKLSKIMIEDAMTSLEDIDIILYVIDATNNRIDNETLNKIIESKKKTILIINKIDLVSANDVANIINEYKNLYNFKAIIPVSVTKNKNLDAVIDEIENNLDEGVKYYDEDEYTDQTLRQIAEEIIREKALKLLRDEVPHGIYVDVTKMKTRKTIKDEKIFDIDATIYCLKKSHKGIIIGKDGSMLKRIGTYSREDLEKMLSSKVNLSLWVKVDEDWINNDKIVKRFKNNNE